MPRNKDPAVLFYPADFIAATVLWNNEEIGRYIKLLCIQFLQDGLTKEELDSVAGDSDKIKSKFPLCSDGMYRNPRMTEEKEKRAKFSESRRANANKRYECTRPANGMQVQSICNASAEHMINENINENINRDISKDSSRIIKHKYGKYSNVLLSDDELEKLKAEFSDWEERIERLSEYIASSGKSYKSHLATIRAWARRDKDKDKPKYSNYNAEDAISAALRRSYGGTG